MLGIRIPVATVCLALASSLAAQPVLTGHKRLLHGTEVVFLRGTNEQRGFTEGFLRAEAIRKTFRGWALRRFKTPTTWTHVVRPTAKRRFVTSPRLRARAEATIRGIKAAGEKAAYIPELKRDLEVGDLLAIPALIDAAGLFCSSVATWGDGDQNGAEAYGPIVCRNLDYPSTKPLLQNIAIFVQAPEGDRHGTVSVGWNSAWLTTGVSDAGVFVAIHDVRAKAFGKQEYRPRMVALQDLLERLTPSKDTALGAAEILRENHFAFGGNAMLAWCAKANRGAAVLEFGPAREKKDSVVIRRPQGRTAIVCTNHWRNRVEPRRCSRFGRITEAANEFGQTVDSETIWKAAATAREDLTLHTVLVDLAKRTLRAEFRLEPSADKWRALKTIKVADLFAEANKAPPKRQKAENGRHPR